LSGLTWLGHSTVVIDVDGTRLVTDPVLGRRVWHLRREAAVDLGLLGALDGILVSHAHFDHLDHASLRLLDRSLPVVAPSGVGGLLRRWGFVHVHEVVADDKLELGGLALRVTHAEHESRRWPLTPRSASVGYVVKGSTSIYFAGDTDLFEGMSALAGSLDVALLPVAGWGSKVGVGHLDPLRAAQALRLLRPRLAIPIHWGTLSPLNRSVSTDAPEAFRRHAAELAPKVEVRILEPGAALTLE